MTLAASFGFQFDWLDEFCEKTADELIPLEKSRRETWVWASVQSAALKITPLIREAKKDGMSDADIEACLKRVARSQLGLDRTEVDG